MRRITALGLALLLTSLGGCGDDDGSSCVDNDGDGYGVGCDLGDDCDDTDDTIHTGCDDCVDMDGDGHDANVPAICPSGDDHCDGDPNNWTVDGCASCADGDGDGYGAGCDQGDDCNDNDDSVHDTCNCVDMDGDGHDAYSATLCPSGDDECDGDPSNWTPLGCASCADTDGDGYGTDCDLGPDCLEGDANLHDNCQTVLFRGDYLVNDTGNVGMASFPGPAMTTMSVAGLDATAMTQAMALSPGRSLLALAGTGLSGNNVVNLYDAEAGGTATIIVSYSEAWEVTIRDLAFSADGAWIAYLADAELEGTFDLHVVPTDGSAPPKRVSPAPSAADQDVMEFRWSPNVSGAVRHIAYRRHHATLATHGLYLVEITAATPASVEIQAEYVVETIGFDFLYQLYYRINATGLHQIMRTDTMYTSVVQVSGTILANGDGEASVRTASLSPTGAMLAFAADSPTRFLREVFVLNVLSNMPDQVSDTGAITPGPGPGRGPVSIVWSPDEALLGLRSNWQLDASETATDMAAWVVPASTPAGGVRLIQILPQWQGKDVLSMAFSADSQRLFILGDLVDDNEFELYSTTDFTTEAQDPTSLLIQDVVADGDVNGMVVW